MMNKKTSYISRRERFLNRCRKVDGLILTSEALDYGRKEGLPERTVKRILNEHDVFQRIEHGVYLMINNNNMVIAPSISHNCDEKNISLSDAIAIVMAAGGVIVFGEKNQRNDPHRH